jgi:hypothetical protein
VIFFALRMNKFTVPPTEIVPMRLLLLLAFVVAAAAALLVWFHWAPRLPVLRRPVVAALGAAVPAALIVLATVFFAAEVLGNYGVLLFAGLPFEMGLVSALLLACGGPAQWEDCAFAATLAAGLCTSLVLGFGLEGVVCLVISLPLAIPMALVGASLGFFLQESFWKRRGAVVRLVLLLAASPLLMGAEAALDREPPVFAVTTAVEVDAPPKAVWEHVVAVPELPPPREAIFRLGVAYPLGADLRGRGAGALRTCRFSTGTFVEPVTVWDEPRLLRFAVTASPPVLRELSPFPDLHPPHIEGFFQGRQGQFRLVELPGDRTRVEGTTWYQHDIWPASYWRLWSDWFVRQVHRRVLEQVAARAEGRG